MGHRAKHRHAALIRRVATGRLIKSDETPAGHARCEAARPEAEALLASQNPPSVFARALKSAQEIVDRKASEEPPVGLMQQQDA